MMYPVLAKVRYDRLDTVTGDRKLLLSSLALNWVLGPALMFALAWLLLPDLPEYRTGLIIVGLARCIAMVIIWNDLACGDREAAAVLVALNSIFEVIMFAVLGWFYLSVLPGSLGLEQTTISTSPWQIAKSCSSSWAFRCWPDTCRAASGKRRRAAAGTRPGSCHALGRGRSTGCCSPS
jgi:ACR3 family arsenite efflux pump ArsB